MRFSPLKNHMRHSMHATQQTLLSASPNDPNKMLQGQQMAAQ
jgi:hypothetical protein